ncbi:hypothetical protein C9I56_11135 [Paraburkholderia caribensis]|uniref:hypothetical protein n=1 Tax=Paraburkholderia caribensis TaxID=75105 RepID=UPI000D1680A8|nr:hypothetical protein [Paraburkholderia caribensis]PTB28836.1 hypothetical protein C9I56_11135 [Paraburkholderia caribensis]
MSSLVNNPIPVWLDLLGNALQGGSIYIGLPNTDPTKNPISVYQDEALSIPFMQPIPTTDGMPTVAGSPRQIFLGLGNPTFSLAVFDSAGNLVQSLPEVEPAASVAAAGDLTQNVFVNGTDFTPNVTTSLTLSADPGAPTNLWVDFDAVPQFYPDDFTLNGRTLTFTSPIPNIGKVRAKWGSTVVTGTPGTGTVTDSSIAAGTALYNRITEWVDITDPTYGAKGDYNPTTGTWTTDNTAAIQAALNSGKGVTAPPGQFFYVGSGVSVPVTCPGIMMEGATFVGPGSTSTVDGLAFNNWYQGGGDQITHQRGQSFQLPNVQAFRYGIALYNSAWVMARCDMVKGCEAGVYSQCDTGKYVVECDIAVRQITQCDHGFHEKIAANTGGDTEGVQGCRFECFYLSSCNVGIYRDNAATSVNTFNEYYIVELDANGCSGGTGNAYAIENTAISSAFAGNVYRIPLGPINCNATPSPFSRCTETNSKFEVLGFCGTDVSPYAWAGFLPGGFRPLVRPSAGVLNVYVDVNHGNDATGDGSVSNPYNTIAYALGKIQNLDLCGNAVIMWLLPGTYTIGLNLNTDQGPYNNGHLYLRGSTGDATQIIVSGGINASGPGSRLTVEYLTVSGNGIVADNNAKVDFDNLIFAGVGSNNHITSKNGATVTALGPVTITSGGNSFASAIDGRITLDGVTYTLTGTPTFSTAFAYAAYGRISAIGSTFSGAATGNRYSALINGVINTAGGGANFFPGSVAGSSASGGQYV